MRKKVSKGLYFNPVACIYVELLTDQETSQAFRKAGSKSVLPEDPYNTVKQLNLKFLLTILCFIQQGSRVFTKGCLRKWP